MIKYYYMGCGKNKSKRNEMSEMRNKINDIDKNILDVLEVMKDMNNNVNLLLDMEKIRYRKKKEKNILELCFCF